MPHLPPRPPQDSGSQRGGSGPQRVSPQELRAALEALGCGRPGQRALAVWYLGVSFEYRRQGLGSQLLDLAKEVAAEAG